MGYDVRCGAFFVTVDPYPPVEGLVLPSYLEEWVEILLGLALAAVPWTIGYESGQATVNSVLSGILVILLAVSELWTDREFITWWHDRWHHSAS